MITAALLSWLLVAAPPAAPDLVDVTTVVPDLVLDLRYASENNFLKRRLYPVARCLLRREAAERLKVAADLLRKQGYRVKAWDCYRPHRVQKVMWEAHPVRGYVAPPQPGSVHNRGGAVDVSLADLEGRDVEMPTDFDDFTTRANLHSARHTPIAVERRKVLRDAFEAAGFRGIRSEWWHFESQDAERFPVLDVPLEAVR
ncbi:MAG: M15 family metallopeptidase [Deltaproteobacteria bacterium]|nr:M15 family metallopeptidase [Deltaproteobacteria bacterium]